MKRRKMFLYALALMSIMNMSLNGLVFAQDNTETSSESGHGHIEDLGKISPIERKKFETQMQEGPEDIGKIEWGIGLTGIFAGSMNNNPNPNHASPSLSGDFEVGMKFFDHGRGFVHVETGIGEGLNNDAPFDSLLFGLVNQDANPGLRTRDLEIAEAYYEGFYFNNGFTFTIGMLDPVVYFDENLVANDETSQYLNGGFVNNTCAEFPGYSLGATIKVQPFNWLSIKGGIFEGDSDWKNIEKDPFWIAQIGFHPTIANRNGNYLFYVWGNHTDHTNVDTGATNAAGYGFGLSLDQQIMEWLRLFGRFGLQSKSIYQAEMAYSMGLELSGSLYNRSDDAFGMAFGQAVNNDKVAVGNNESVVEAYYRLQLGDHIGLSPDVQFIINPGASSTNNNVVVASLRAQIDF